MSETANLRLPLLEAAQSQKHITHNESLIILDAVAQLSIKSRALSFPPPTPNEGDRYFVADNATSDWAGQEKKLAFFTNGAWQFLTIKTGWHVWIEDEKLFLVFNGEEWKTLQDFVQTNKFNSLGIGATPDEYNKFIVASSSVLFTHNGSDQRVVINKFSKDKTASVVFQNAYEGRAEFGLTGDDNFHLKVSADNSTWREALVIDAVTGKVAFQPASISNEALEEMPALTVKARTHSMGPPENLTISALTEHLDIMTSTKKGLVPPSGGGTEKFLRADGTWVLINVNAGDGTNIIEKSQGWMQKYAGHLIIS